MGSVKLQDNKVNKLSYSFCMNLSDVNSKIVFPVEMFATVMAGEGLHLHVYGVGVPVQSALVFCLELTLVTIKSKILVVFHYMDVQLFPFIESLFTMFAGVYLVKPLVVLL